jgi:hypothetical protein
MKGVAFLLILLAGATPLLAVALIVIGSTLGLAAWRPPLLWTDQFGSPDAASGVSAAVADSKGVYVVGYRNATSGTFGTQFIRRYDTNGQVAWTTIINNISGLSLYGVALGSDGVYAVGGSYENDTILKFDLNGTMLWTHYAEFSIRFGGISVTSNGLYLSGYSGHPLTNQSFTGEVLFVRKYDPMWKVIWTNEFANSSISAVSGIYTEATEIYILAGSRLVAYDLAGNELWSHQIGTSPLVIVTSSISGDMTGVYVSGRAADNRFSPSNGFLTKYDYSGNMVWNVAFDPPDGSSVGYSSLSSDSSGVYMSLGTSGGNGFVKKFDSSGNLLWSFQTPLAPRPLPAPYRVAAATGSFYLAGATGMPSAVSGLVQGFSSSSSLIFFGVNPPFSFVAIGALIALAISGMYYLRRRQMERGKRHPPSASLDRYRGLGRERFLV